MKFLDLFAGIGGFRRGMELAGHECVGYCESDKFAAASYTAMHLATPRQLNEIKKLPKRKRVKEIVKEEYRNGEWYADDIRTITAASIPESDCWCFGFPCQDISIAGRKAGFEGDRSSLFFSVTKLIRELQDDNRPTYLFAENVGNLLSVNRGLDFAKLLIELDGIGYDTEWKVLNSKDFGVPQNRPRTYIIGHFRGRNRREIFPSVKIYPSTKQIKQIANIMPTKTRKNPNQGRVYSVEGVSPCLTASQGGNRQPIVAQNNTLRKLTPKEYFRLQGWSDDYFERAALVNSDSQLYNQGGNSVTVTVIQAIAKEMR